MNTETVNVRCKIEEVFAGPFIELIGLAPKNPVVRGLILSQTGKLPGPERQTFEAIKEWVELTCDPRAGGGHPAKVSGLADTAFAIKVEFSDTEYGRANYSVGRSAEDEFVLAEDEVLDLVQAAIDCGNRLDKVVEQLAELIDSEAWERCDPSLDDTGDYEYENHDLSDTDNSTVEFSKPQVRERLILFLRTRHPELLEELA